MPPVKSPWWLALIAAGLVVLMWALSTHFARAQHTHEGAVGRFYQSWMMPDSPRTSCCHDQDCAPAASRFINNRWEAEHNGVWVPIPPNKVEQNRDSPDGRSHLCGRELIIGEFTVFCFIRGGGT